jgi:hypothetical protein
MTPGAGSCGLIQLDGAPAGIEEKASNIRVEKKGLPTDPGPVARDSLYIPSLRPFHKLIYKGFFLTDEFQQTFALQSTDQFLNVFSQDIPLHPVLLKQQINNFGR